MERTANGARQIPRELDWVAARANCTAFEIFSQLRTEVERDVETRTARSQDLDQSLRRTFLFSAHDATTFSVLRNGLPEPSQIQFRLVDQTIIVKDAQNKTMMSAVLSLDDAGDCVLRVAESDKGPLDLTLQKWQFRRRALEALFFDPQN